MTTTAQPTTRRPVQKLRWNEGWGEAGRRFFFGRKEEEQQFRNLAPKFIAVAKGLGMTLPPLIDDPLTAIPGAIFITWGDNVVWWGLAGLYFLTRLIKFRREENRRRKSRRR